MRTLLLLVPGLAGARRRDRRRGAGAPARSRCCTPTGWSPAPSAARAEGVRRGLRKREAQGRCPQLTVVEHDPGRDARAFEPVVAAVEELVAGVEVVRPGACALAARGPAPLLRRRGGGGRADRRARRASRARWRARSASPTGSSPPCWPPGPGGSCRRAGRRRSWPGWPVEALDRPDAGRPAAPAGRAHPRRLRRAAGRRRAGPVRVRRGAGPPAGRRAGRAPARRPPAAARPDGDRRATTRRWTGSTWPRSPPGRWPSGCTSGWPGTGWPAPGSASRRSPSTGEELHRVWRHDGLLDRRRHRRPGALAARRLALRQHRPGRRAEPARPTAGIDPAAAGPGRGGRARPACSPGCGARPARSGERAHRALSRVQGLLGPEAVVTAVLGGGRDPGRPGAPGAVGRRAAPAPAAGASRRGPGGCRARAGRPVLPEPLRGDGARRRRRAGRWSTRPAGR